MYGVNQFKSLHGFNFTLIDGRTFNAHGKNVEDAVAELKDYLFCEYDEHEVNIANVEQFN